MEKLLKEPKSYWVNLLDKYFVRGNRIAIQAVPSVAEHEKITEEEKQRIEEQIKRLGKEGLEEKAAILQKAVEFNEREPPESMLTSVPIPSTKSIQFHNIARYSSDSSDNQLGLSEAPVFTYFDNVKTGFVYVSKPLNHIILFFSVCLQYIYTVY